jgi:hypothetical protein
MSENKKGRLWANELNRQFSEEETQMANKHMKKYLTYINIKEVQIKVTLRFHLTIVRLAIVNKTRGKAGCCWLTSVILAT